MTRRYISTVTEYDQLSTAEKIADARERAGHYPEGCTERGKIEIYIREMEAKNDCEYVRTRSD